MAVSERVTMAAIGSFTVIGVVALFCGVPAVTTKVLLCIVSVFAGAGVVVRLWR